MANLRSFEELECWKEAAALRRKIRDVSLKFPPEEKYRLTDQIIRSSRSVTANIAEGFGRFHFQENTQYCRISRGSLSETVDHLLVARESNFITDDELIDLKGHALKCITILNGYINYLQMAKKIDQSTQ